MENKPQNLFASIAPTIVLFFLALFLYGKFGPGIPLTVSQVTTNKTDFFTVSADGKVFAKPDVATVSLGFTANGQAVGTVQTQANQTINKITAAVKGLGIEDKDVQTTSYNLRPDYDYSGGNQRIKGYIIDVNILVKVRDFNKINNVIDAATTNGANQVGGLSFTIDDPEKYQEEARKLAIDKAKQKASRIAAETGISLGKIINVSESQNYPGPRPVMMAKDAVGFGGGAPAVPTEIEAGQSEINVNVILSYETR